jgi:hypothetical protein
MPARVDRRLSDRRALGVGASVMTSRAGDEIEPRSSI